MSELGSTALHLRIAEFKFAHKFIICNQLPETELIFGLNIHREFSLSHACDKEINCYIQKDGKFLVYTHTCDCMATIGTVKSTLKVQPQHNGVVPIKISGPIIKTHMAYFLTDDSTLKWRDPIINIISGIHKIKGKTSVNVSVSNYTNKHLMFHKGDYIEHLEPAVMDNNTIDQQETHQTYSITLKKMMSEIVTPDTFNPPCHELSAAVQNDLDLILWGYESQFAKDETSIGTTTLTSKHNRYWYLQTSFSKALPHCYEALPVEERWHRKVACSKSHLYQPIQLVSPDHSGTQRWWWKMFGNRLQNSQ